ncbi:hypothetical protein IWQ60_000471 [Tieghemiomyces parasiticus]|uniref:Cyclin N-terminal domain-containing protein n=1 Tax=Tieghemiomyces parasiticus TaxID=78921 RepID=A0A9W8DXI7_9FUNG|nr:hypothetical protein IWQ60_000471 [Tieghemiomyces parasiticus]
MMDAPPIAYSTSPLQAHQRQGALQFLAGIQLHAPPNLRPALPRGPKEPDIPRSAGPGLLGPADPRNNPTRSAPRTASAAPDHHPSPAEAYGGSADSLPSNHSTTPSRRQSAGRSLTIDTSMVRRHSNASYIAQSALLPFGTSADLRPRLVSSSEEDEEDVDEEDAYRVGDLEGDAHHVETTGVYPSLPSEYAGTPKPPGLLKPLAARTDHIGQYFEEVRTAGPYAADGGAPVPLLHHGSVPDMAMDLSWTARGFPHAREGSFGRAWQSASPPIPETDPFTTTHVTGHHGPGPTSTPALAVTPDAARLVFVSPAHQTPLGYLSVIPYERRGKVGGSAAPATEYHRSRSDAAPHPPYDPHLRRHHTQPLGGTTRHPPSRSATAGGHDGSVSVKSWFRAIPRLLNALSSQPAPAEEAGDLAPAVRPTDDGINPETDGDQADSYSLASPMPTRLPADFSVYEHLRALQARSSAPTTALQATRSNGQVARLPSTHSYRRWLVPSGSLRPVREGGHSQRNSLPCTCPGCRPRGRVRTVGTTPAATTADLVSSRTPRPLPAGVPITGLVRRPSPEPINAQPGPTYDPNHLDDPDLKADGRRTASNLAGFVGSIIQHTKPADLKRELNALFRSKHGDAVHPTMTLSKVRTLKAKLIACAQLANNELSSVANAYVYLEKLVLSRRVWKTNRRCIAAVCLLLAVKVNEPHGDPVTNLLAAIQKVLGVSPDQVLHHEFAVFADLHFALYVPAAEFMPHLNRVLQGAGMDTVQEYIGSDTTFYME